MKARSMKVTAEIRKIYDENSNVKATASLTIEGAFVVRGVRLISGRNGLFVSMPSHRHFDGEYMDICFPINSDARLKIHDAVIEAYEKALHDLEHDEEAETGGDADLRA
jgi:stage V sporulation protein G